MPENVAAPKKKARRPFSLIVGIIAAVIVLGVGALAVGMALEENNAFCSSCHTQPEVTYYQRTQAADPSDLASFHVSKGGHCVACHSGPGVTGRIETEVMGAVNAAQMLIGTAKQPGKLAHLLPTGNCLKCHDEVTGDRERQNHFHYYLARWQATDPQAGTCASCHSGHATDGDPNARFQNDSRTHDVCSSCHAVLREGGD